LRALETVAPNDWNPNRMTELQVESTRDGFRRHGWLASYALLVWGTDERGREQNIIIDGEHRWRIAREMGFREGPMVFMYGVTKAQAIELTIELDAKRGRFDDVALRDAIKLIGVDDGLAFRLGFDDATFKALMEESTVLPPEDFSEVTIDAKVDYHCPKCGYEWSGQPSSKKKTEKAAAEREALQPAE
jgi:ParB-like chromosome segregation protein Spo0J